MEKVLRIALIGVLALAMILSCTVVGEKLTDPASYAHTIEALDQNRTTVLSLSAASAAASAAVSALPDDICSPLAQEISQFTTWFLMILSVIYLEKYLLTILGFLSCYLLLPVGCGVLLTNCFFPKRFLQELGMKLVALGVALLLIIPTGVWISDRINDIYTESIQVTVQSAGAVTDNLIGEMTGEDAQSTSVIDEAKAILGDVSGSVAGVVDQFRNVLNRFIEATAVMIVTNCLIPLLVIAFFGWVIRTLFAIPVPQPVTLPKPHRKNGLHIGQDI